MKVPKRLSFSMPHHKIRRETCSRSSSLLDLGHSWGSRSMMNALRHLYPSIVHWSTPAMLSTSPTLVGHSKCSDVSMISGRVPRFLVRLPRMISADIRAIPSCIIQWSIEQCCRYVPNCSSGLKYRASLVESRDTKDRHCCDQNCVMNDFTSHRGWQGGSRILVGLVESCSMKDRWKSLEMASL
jgi:hypothetical protein